MRKRTKVRVRLRRFAWLTSILIGCLCACEGPGLLVNSLLHGYEGAAAAVLVLLTAGAAAALCDWLVKGGL